MISPTKKQILNEKANSLLELAVEKGFVVKADLKDDQLLTLRKAMTFLKRSQEYSPQVAKVLQKHGL